MHLQILFFTSFLLSIIRGFTGLSAGMLLLPLLLHFGFNTQQIAGIFLVSGLIPSSLPAALLYLKSGHVLWKPVIAICIATMIGSYIGAYLGVNEIISKKLVYRMFVVIMIIATGYTIWAHCL